MASDEDAQAPLVAHGRNAPELGNHLRHHGAQMGLLALQLAKRIADVDAFYRTGVEGLRRGAPSVASRIMSEMSSPWRDQAVAKSVW